MTRVHHDHVFLEVEGTSPKETVVWSLACAQTDERKQIAAEEDFANKLKQNVRALSKHVEPTCVFTRAPG